MESVGERVRRKMVIENRIYIMPTGMGMVFLAAIIVMVLVAATYNNNLIFILTFFMAALFVITMMQTHFNLKSVRLAFLSSDAGFEGEKLTVLFRLFLKRTGRKRAIRVVCRSKKWRTLEIPRADLTPREMSKPVRVGVARDQRGVFALPEFMIETRFPLGLFRAWKVFRPQGELVVYPRPAGPRELAPVNSGFGEEDLGLRTSPEGDFGELKPYQPGESYHQIAWKHFARTGQLYSKVHWGEAQRCYKIPWDPRGAPVEAYLRQMSRWIQAAVEENAAFEMELPSKAFESGSGREHAQQLWRALAAFREAA